MLICEARTCSLHPVPARRPGFTLLEMLVVLVVLSLIAMVSVPLFQTLVQGTVQTEATRLSRLVRVLRNEAILTQTDYRLVFDLKEQSYWVEVRNGERFQVRNDDTLLRKHVFPASFQLTDLSILGNTSTRNAAERPIPVSVDATGFMDPFLLHFAVDGAAYTFKVSGFRSTVDLLSGYVRE